MALHGHKKRSGNEPTGPKPRPKPKNLNKKKKR